MSIPNPFKTEPLVMGALITAAGAAYQQWETTGQVPSLVYVLPVFAAIMRQFVTPAQAAQIEHVVDEVVAQAGDPGTLPPAG